MRKLMLAAFAALTPFSASSEIGSLAAVNRDVQGTRPQEAPRTLSLNDRLIQNERIQTSSESGGQVLFLDQTTLTLTPNSDIILDKYVYDPDKDSGDLQITMLKGAMRMVGGRITKKSDATIKTPSATIGIRGGIGNITVREDGSTEYMHIAGFKATITSNKGGQPVTITREGGTAVAGPSASGSSAFAAAATASQSGGGSATPTGDASAGQAGDGAATTAGDANGDGDVTYTGVASSEQVNETMSVSAGSGNGGSETSSAPGATDGEMVTFSQQVSGDANATTAPPISTAGEQETLFYNEEPPLFAERPLEEFADDNQAQAVAGELTQIFDAVTFAGVWSPVAGLNDGSFVQGDGLAFRMNYSLKAQEGFVTVELPETGDLAAANVTTFDGVALKGDRLLVLGDDARNISADTSQTTLLGGSADGTSLAISPEDVASGSVFIDYAGSSLDNAKFVTGSVTPVTGAREIDVTVRERTTAVRQFLNQR